MSENTPVDNKVGFNIDPDIIAIVSNRIHTISENTENTVSAENTKNKKKTGGSNVDNNAFVQLLKISNERRINASVLTVAIKYDRNVSAMCRTCEIFGMRDYITLGDNHIDMRSSVGSHNYLNFIKCKCDIGNQEEVNSAFDLYMRKYNMTPIFVEQGGTNLSEVNWTKYFDKHICFVLGAEDEGVPESILNQKDRYEDSIIVSIEQQGIMRSLNVSIACGIILYNYSMQFKQYYNK
jgi:tRNA G18 (ribose-2'-O)-methylase SpoU